MTCSESCCADVRVFSLVCFSALADKPAQRRQSDPALSVASAYSRDQILVGNALASGGGDHRIEARESLALDVAFVQPERKFLDVPAQMLAACVVIDANHAALHDRENALNAVCGDVAAHVFAR